MEWIQNSGHGGKFPILVMTGAFEATHVLDKIKDVQLALVLLGLVVGIFLSYRISLRLFTDKRRAVKVMLPVVALILGYSYINMLALIFPMVMRTVSYF
jgi:hypothetical protein